MNLYELIKQNQFRGLSTTLVRVFAQQLLNGLSLLNKARLIHCDLKPENILLKKYTLECSLSTHRANLSLAWRARLSKSSTLARHVMNAKQSTRISSQDSTGHQKCFWGCRKFCITCFGHRTLIRPRYSSAIDMWSLGCIVVELFLGLPLFPGSSEYNQVSRITEMLGLPPMWMLEAGKQSGEFFEKTHDEYGRRSYRLKTMEQYSREHGSKEQPSKKYFQATTLPEIIRSYSMPRKNMKQAEVDRGRIS